MRYSASKHGVTLTLGVGVVQDHWKWRRSIDHYTTSYWSAIVSIAVCCTIFKLNNRDLEKVTEDHSNWHHSKDWVRFPIRLP